MSDAGPAPDVGVAVGAGPTMPPERPPSSDPPRPADLGTPRLPLVFALASVIVLADQLTKRWAVDRLPGDPIELFWTLRLRLVTNTGAAFSFSAGSGPLIGVLALVVVALLVWTGRSVGTRTGALGLGLVLGGALGNLLDRGFREADTLLGGAVVDFIDLQWWPVFNVADMGVVVGAGMLLIGSLLEGE